MRKIDADPSINLWTLITLENGLIVQELNWQSENGMGMDHMLKVSKL